MKRVKLTCPTEDSLEVYAETSKKITFKELGIKHRHGEFTSYYALIRMPVAVNESKITKKFKRGLLEVHVPRRTHSK
jgi:HSP20 family molecular chaperone IbpA